MSGGALPRSKRARQSRRRKELLMNAVSWARGLAFMSLLLAVVVTHAGAESGQERIAEKVRAANDRFKDVKTAVAEGYAPIPCASGVDGGAMGVHYVNTAYLKDEVVSLKRPQAVMYEPT